MNKISTKFELITNEYDFQALEPEWNTLLQDSCANGVFLTWEWVSTWWSCFGQGSQLWILIVRSTDSDQILGLAPLFLHRSSLRPGILPTHRELAFIGSNIIAPDHLDFIIRKGYEKLIAAKLIKIIDSDKGWDILHLDGLAKDSPIVPFIKARENICGNNLTYKSGAIIRLPKTWDTYHSSLGKNLRKNLRRYARQLEQEYPDQVRYSLAKNPDEIISTLKTLFRLADGVSESLNRKYTLRTPDMQDFHFRVAIALHQQDWVRIYKITVGEEIIAVLYAYNYDGVISDYQTGYSLSWQNFRLGQLILAHSIRQAIDQGAQVYDFLRGEHSYLDTWTADSKQDIYLKIANNLKGRSLITTFSVARALRYKISSLLEKFNVP